MLQLPQRLRLDLANTFACHAELLVAQKPAWPRNDEPVRAFILEQDREISEKSGKAPLAIKRIEQLGEKKKKKK